jgi:hypothetical protein
MRRPWQTADTADSFWIDIQTQVKYCGLRDAYHTNHVLKTLWRDRYGDDEAKKEFALHPKWTAADCYAKAKALEQVKQKDGATINVVKTSNYKAGKPKGSKPARSGRSQTPGPAARTTTTSGDDNGACLNCGFEAHGNDGRCPAAGKRCNSCGKTGHFGRHCPFGGPATANATAVSSTPFVANNVFAGATTTAATSTQRSGPITPFFINTVDTLDVPSEVGTIPVCTDVTETTRHCEWGNEDSKWFGVRANFREGDKTVSGTITGVCTTTRGDKAAYLMADGDRTPKVRPLKELVVQQHRLQNGNWVPVRKKINRRPE